jgi:hypothetical protein
MKHHDGEFVSVSDEGLTLQEKGSDVSVKREDASASRPPPAPGAASTR